MAPTYNLNHVTNHPFMTCIVKVNTEYSYSRSRRTVAKVLDKCHGVHSFRMDNNGLVEISGTVNPSSLLKALGRSGRSAEICWFQFGECSSNLFMPKTGNGRFLQAGNLGPTLPSHNNNHDYGYGYGYGYEYDHNCNYYSYDRRSYDNSYESGHGYGGNASRYCTSSLAHRGGEDIGCCRMM